MKKYIKEIVLMALVALPLIYLAIIWNKLPDSVPTHFNIEGNPDDWSAKSSLIFIVGGVGIGTYLLMLLIPTIDPKKKIQEMGNSYYWLRFILTFFISLLLTFCLYWNKAGSLKTPGMVFVLIGLLFAFLGIYFKFIKPNYFIGIRTPWTLESENVWKKTHNMAGPLWLGGGTLIAFLAVIMGSSNTFIITFIVLISVMVIIPVAFSYVAFQKEKAS